VRLEEVGEVALVLRREVDDDDPRDAAVLGDVLEELLERGQPPGGGPDADDDGPGRALRLGTLFRSGFGGLHLGGGS
jgi:hypothetical protein